MIDLLQNDKILKNKYKKSNDEIEFCRRLKIFDPIKLTNKNGGGEINSLIINLAFSGYTSQDDNMDDNWGDVYHYKTAQEIIGIRWEAGQGSVKTAGECVGKAVVKFVPNILLNLTECSKKLIPIHEMNYCKKIENRNLLLEIYQGKKLLNGMSMIGKYLKKKLIRNANKVLPVVVETGEIATAGGIGSIAMRWVGRAFLGANYIYNFISAYKCL